VDVGKPSGQFVAALKTIALAIREPSGIASTIALLVGLLLALVPNLGDTVRNVGYGVIAAATFAYISQFFANSQQVARLESTLNGIGDELVSSTRNIGEELVRTAKSDIRAIRPRYLPTDEYPETNTPNPIFNRQYGEDLVAADQIYYRGQSGKYLFARLARTPTPQLRELQIILEHPFSDDVIDTRARILQEQSVAAGAQRQDFDLLRFQVRTGMLHAIVGLFDLRVDFPLPIRLRYTKTLLQVRTEIVGNSTYITYEPRNRKGLLKFSDAYRFLHDSLVARLSRLEFEREFSRLATTIEFHGRHGDAELLTHLQALGFNSRSLSLESIRRANELTAERLHSSLLLP
jgi:hypothetical protein